MNLPLYSPSAPASGLNPGYGAYALCVHSQTSPRSWCEALAGARRRRVEPPVLGKGPVRRRRLGRDLPLRLRREPRPREAGVGVRLVRRDVGDRLGLVEPTHPAERELPPRAALLPPVQRRPPPVPLHRRPPVGEPQLRPRSSRPLR